MIARSILCIVSAVYLVLISGLPSVAQTGPSVLATGAWLRVAVGTDGFYRITPAQLREAGWNPREIDPRRLQLYGYGGGMLPQSLDRAYRPSLPENAIWVDGEADGRLDDHDAIVFYGQAAGRLRYQPAGDSLAEKGPARNGYALDYQKNLYTDSAYYFLTVGDAPGKRVTTAASEANASLTVTDYDDYVVYEKDEFNLRKPDAGSGRTWYGETLANGQGLDFKLGPNGWSTTQDARVTVAVLGTAPVAATVSVRLNEQVLGELAVDPIEVARYAAKGNEVQGSFTASAASLSASVRKVNLRYQGEGVAYLDKFYVEGSRPLRDYGQTVLFRKLASTQHAYTTFRIAEAAEEMIVWDVTDPQQPVRRAGTLGGTTWQFTAPTQGTLREFAAVAPADLPEAERVSVVANQNLKDGVVPNLVIVSPAAFRSEAERLATLRRQHDRLTVRVVTPQQIYNEFASGRQDVSAIRNYMKYLYDTDSAQLQHLLLLGKGSYDYRDYLPYNTNLVPTYQSRNSVHPIYSYSSDDYYAFLEDHEGTWEESYAGDHTMDIGVGRLPVKSVAEARTVVDKLIHYATGATVRGRWRKEVVFVADDGDNNKHQRDAEQLTRRLDTAHTDYSLTKIYLDAYEQQDRPGGEASEAATRRIEQALKQGALIVNFTGHGSETRWTQENIFNLNTIAQLRNYDRLPFFVTATCEFGRHDDPARVSGAEQLVLSETGGAIGLVTTARPVFSNSNLLLNRAFYTQVFAREDGRPLTIGEVFRRTKNQGLNGRVNRNFSLLGDPSMTLAYPEDQVVITRTEVQRAHGGFVASDTLAALDRVRLSGQIIRRSDRQRSEDFDGTVTVEVLDKATVTKTFGSDAAVMQFEERNSVVHRGQARVRRGQFTLEFIMPKDIDDQIGTGVISAYARSEQSDAHGADRSWAIGGRSPAPGQDRTPPTVQLYLDDTTFVAGGFAADRPTLVAHLTDESGISLITDAPEQNMTATLIHRETEEVQSWSLVAFYETDPDTYQSGTVVYPIDKLKQGNYTLTLRASDTYGNPAQAQTQFVVGGDQQLQVVEAYNYPNPFNRETTFVVDHNRPGDDLSLRIDITDERGRRVAELQQDFSNSTSRLRATWEGQGTLGVIPNQLLSPGLYVARIRVRSLTDQVAYEKFHKLIISP